MGLSWKLRLQIEDKNSPEGCGFILTPTLKH